MVIRDGIGWIVVNNSHVIFAIEDVYKRQLLPIAIELIEKYRGTDEKKDSPNVSFR